MELKLERMFDLVEVVEDNLRVWDDDEVYLALNYIPRMKRGFREVTIKVDQRIGVDKVDIYIPIPGSKDSHVLTITEEKVSRARYIAAEEAILLPNWSLDLAKMVREGEEEEN